MTISCCVIMEFSLNGTGIHELSEFRESDKSLKHSHMFLSGTVVASWSLTQEVVGWEV